MKLSSWNPTLNKHLYCTVCKQLFKNPMRLNCGHTFCQGCCAKSKAKCPTCKKVVKQSRRDILAGRLIDQLKVECTNNCCPWKGTFADFKFHLEQCELKQGIQDFLQRLDSIKQQAEQQLSILRDQDEKAENNSGQATHQKQPAEGPTEENILNGVDISTKKLELKNSHDHRWQGQIRRELKPARQNQPGGDNAQQPQEEIPN